MKIGPGKGEILSCPDAIGRALERFMLGKPISFQEEVLGHTLDRFTKEEETTEEREENAPRVIEIRTSVQEKGEEGEEVFHVGVCPDCGSPLIYKEGCDYCPVCFYTKCD